jgi:acetolactate synthase-1/2/3 large subunit
MIKEMTFKEVLGKCLKREGVEYVFGLPGHGNIAMLDGMIKEGISIRVMHHETIAGHVADGYSRASGKPGVVCLTCSPGAFNTMLSVTTAAMDCTAMVYIVGDTPLRFAGKSCYEEFDLASADDQFGVLRHMFKRAWKVTQPCQLPDIISQAFNSAISGKPGPVLIDVPLDLQTMKMFVKLPDTTKRRPTYKSSAEHMGIKKAAELLDAAKCPVIFAGGGTRLSKATDELIKLAERINAVVVSSLAGSGSFPTKHQNFAGTIGSYGVRTANDICKNSDLILAVGTRFEESETSMWLPEFVFNPDTTKFIQIDIDPREVGKNYPVEVGLVGDAKTILNQIIEAVSPVQPAVAESRSNNIEIVKQGKKLLKEKIEKTCVSSEVPINPRRVLRALERTMPDNTTMTLDPSWCRVGMLQQMDLNSQEDAYIVSGILPIGWSSSACIGINMAMPHRKVVAITGDGGFLLNNNAVASAVENNLPIVWVILNNGGYNSLGVLSTVYFGEQEGSWFKEEKTGNPYSPDYAMLAKSYGAHGELIKNPDDLEDAFRRAFAANAPYVLDIRISGPGSRLVRTAQVTWDYFWERATNKSAR